MLSLACWGCERGREEDRPESGIKESARPSGDLHEESISTAREYKNKGIASANIYKIYTVKYVHKRMDKLK